MYDVAQVESLRHIQRRRRQGLIGNRRVEAAIDEMGAFVDNNMVTPT